MFDDRNPWSDSEFAHVGEVVLHFLEDTTGTWYSRLEELDQMKCRGDLKTVYKLALCMAVVQDTLKKRMGAMDAILRTNEEMLRIKNELDESEPKTPVNPVPDTNKYQTQLPFKGKGPDSDDT
jgi:hypothetical protein